MFLEGTSHLSHQEMSEYLEAHPAGTTEAPERSLDGTRDHRDGQGGRWEIPNPGIVANK